MSRFRPQPVEIRVPLKLVIAGEYAVLDDDGSGLVCAIDRHVVLRGHPAPSGFAVTAEEAGWPALEAPAPLPDGRLLRDRISQDQSLRYRFALAAAELAYAYVAELGLEPRPLRLAIDSSQGSHPLPDGGRVKLGLGTSAATTAAVVAGVLSLHGVPIDRPTFRSSLLKLALLAHARAQGERGSGIDVAASIVGGVVAYTRANVRFLRQLVQSGKTAIEMARAPWPGLKLESVQLPRGARLLVGFTGEPAATVDRVAVYERWRKQHKAQHRQFIELTQRAVALLRAGLESGDAASVGKALTWARGALTYLERGAGMRIETEPLERLARAAGQAGAAGKLSGAGGGDCGIAIAFCERTARAIEDGWRGAGIIPVPASIDRRGLIERPLAREVARA